ncbi:MAG: GtrA family protein [Rikenellaceae bacterium]
MIINKNQAEILRFVLVGILATIIHYGIYYLSKSFIAVNIAYTLGYIISFIANYFLSSYFTFRTNASTRKAVGFGVSHLINYGLHMVLLNTFLHFGLNDKIAPIFVFAIAIPVNFILVRTVLKSKKLQ